MRIALPGLLLLAACSPTAEQENALQVAEASAPEEAEEEGAAEAPPETDPAPDDFANTAWRSTAENGALFVTYLDAGGTYRDLRNGDPWQAGTWEHTDGGELCLTPDTEEAEGGCWQPGRVREGDLLTLTSGDKRIQVRRITYEPPVEEEEEEEEEA